jgi:hypothetical protein
VKHNTTSQFWALYEALPEHIQRLANKNFALLKADPQHPSLHFKKIEDMWSVRVGRSYRALGFDLDGGILWFWIGSHADYDKLI